MVRTGGPLPALLQGRTRKVLPLLGGPFPPDNLRSRPADARRGYDRSPARLPSTRRRIPRRRANRPLPRRHRVALHRVIAGAAPHGSGFRVRSEGLERARTLQLGPHRRLERGACSSSGWPLAPSIRGASLWRLGTRSGTYNVYATKNLKQKEGGLSWRTEEWH